MVLSLGKSDLKLRLHSNMRTSQQQSNRIRLIIVVNCDHISYLISKSVSDFGDASSLELRLILVGNIGCGKTLTADTLLRDNTSVGFVSPSRLCEVRCGESEGSRLRLVETPRWYWKGEHIDSTVERETERALSMTAPGPHAFLILVPIGQFTEVEARIPAELERVFGKGALAHSLVLLTCGDYMLGRDMERYLSVDEPGLKAMVDRCGGRWHVINNRKPHDREQVVVLLEKVRNDKCF